MRLSAQVSCLRVVMVGQQHQHIHVGMRKQLAAAIAAHGDQRIQAGQAGLVPQARRLSSASAASLRSNAPRTPRVEAPLVARRPAGPSCRCGSGRAGRLLGAHGGGRRHGGAAESGRGASGGRQNPGSAGCRPTASAPRSRWGDQHRVFPLGRQRMVLGDDGPAVLPGPSLMSRRPALIMGSMVKVMPGLSSSSVPGRP
jgi:hypothetical protein